MRKTIDVILRPATNDDAIAVRELIFDVLREFHLPPDPNGADADLADLYAHYHSRGGRFDVIVDPLSGGILGSVGLFPIDRQTVELRKMYLRAAARGRGLGKRLLEHAIIQARHLGFHRIMLETAAQLVDAIALYRRYGFTPLNGPIHVKRCDQAFELHLC